MRFLPLLLDLDSAQRPQSARVNSMFRWIDANRAKNPDRVKARFRFKRAANLRATSLKANKHLEARAQAQRTEVVHFGASGSWHFNSND